MTAAANKAEVVVIGGGFAGLAAAVDLAERGRRVLLLERRAFLGGRAYSFVDRATGDTVDNGQHLMMGCYRHTLGFLEKIGALGNVKFQPHARVDFLSDEQGHAAFKCPPLPAPLHLVAGLAGLKTVGWGDRLKALGVGLALRRMNGDRGRLADITVREWLDELGQSERIQRRFWDLIALATLNESPERASADMFARVIEEAFLHTRRDSQLVISRVGLSEMYTAGAKRFIETRGGEVRMNATVERVEFEGGYARALILRGGERVEPQAVVSAVPYFSLKTMIAPEVAAGVEAFRHLDEFQSAPIVSINLWYDEPVTELEFVGLLDSPIEWVFNKNAIVEHRSKRQHLALVISGAHAAAKRPKEELTAMAVNEMRRFFPAAKKQQPAHSFVVREHHATVSHTVGVARLRPAQRTPFANFFLAGDWTDTGLPATIEGAVWSGRECARLLLAADSRVAAAEAA
jgi:hydroxysqualene dehydroxylase